MGSFFNNTINMSSGYGYSSGSNYSYGTGYYNYYSPPLPFEEYHKHPHPKPIINTYSQPPQPSQPTPEYVERLIEEAKAVRKGLDSLDKTFFEHKEFFVVSIKWLNIWKSACCYNELKDGSVPAEIGRIKVPSANGDIVSEKKAYLMHPGSKNYLNIFLKKEAKLDRDYILVTEDIWKHFRQYGGNEIPRFMRHIKGQGDIVDASLISFQILYFFNSSLKRIQRGETKMLRTWVQFDKTATLSDFRAFIKQKIQSEFREHKSDLQRDFLRIWQLDEQVTMGRWIDEMEKLCRMHKGWTYRLQIQAPLLTQDSTLLTDYSFGPETKIVAEILCERENWIFFNKKTPIVSKCDHCDRSTQLPCRCSCKVAYYCSQSCKKANKQRHRYRCQTDTISEEEVTDLIKTDSSKMGMIGLRNLGNTCYMNSGLQCMSHVMPLTNYILQNKQVPDYNTNNPLGSIDAGLAKAYSQLIKSIWYGKDEVIAPVKFKKALGAFQPMFSGYSQQDSGQCLSYLLDGLHQDLNRIKKKEYIESVDDFSRSDHIMAIEAWNNFKLRNNSIIVDHLYGQYKSTVECSTCPNFSITFDPFLILQLPIPLKKTKAFEYYICNDQFELFANKITYESKDVPSLRDCYEKGCKDHGIKNEDRFYAYAASNYFGQYVCSTSKEIESIRKNYKDRKSVILRSLRPWQHQIQESNQNHLIVSNYYMSERDYYQRKCLALIKMVMISKDWTLDKVLSSILSDYMDYIPEYDKSKSVEENFKPLIAGGKLKVTFCKSFGLNCPFCQKRCDGCQIPFSDTMIYGKVFRSDKVQFEINWNKSYFEKLDEKIEKKHGELTTGYSAYYYSRGYEHENAEPCNIEDCFKLFEETEVLDKDNMWYCNKCKQFVCARKTMQIYRLPAVLIICLKRFKSQNKLYMKKINSLVHYPITDLQVGQFAIQKEDKSAVYDLFGVSNHMGGMGGGHYTAHCLDSDLGKWVQYDDSHIRVMEKPREPDSESYILFYQRK